jgi:hypothetical protein
VIQVLVTPFETDKPKEIDVEPKSTPPGNPVVIVYKESLAESMISDLATFGMILLCAWVSLGSAWWTFVTGCIFLFFIISKAIAFTKSSSTLRFYSMDELQDWISKQRLESKS